MQNTCRKLIIAIGIIFNSLASQAQNCVDCGDGSSGTFHATRDTELIGGVYNFEDFIISENVIVKIKGPNPLFFRCKGTITINGILDASGKNGANGSLNLTGGSACAGGYPGADGVQPLTGTSAGSNGNGPGAGNGGINGSGSGAGHALPGSSCSIAGGLNYGNYELTPITAGSGGGSGFGTSKYASGAGGGGGGILQMYSCTAILIGSTGKILSNGGDGGTGGLQSSAGGGGSGGSILLYSRYINNMGTISAKGGNGGISPNLNNICANGGNGSIGRIRIEYNEFENLGTILPAPYEKPVFNAGIRRVVHAKCFNTSTGFIKAKASGGTKPYTYLWSTGSTNDEINNLPAGIYTVTITDANGCSVTEQTEVKQPAEIIPDIISYPPSCENSGDAVILPTAIGGNPYPYKKSLFTTLWSNNSSNGLMFDVEVNLKAKLNYITVNLPDTSQQTISVYIKTGSMTQHEFNPSVWQLVNTYQVTGSGTDDETPLDLSTLPELIPGKYSFYIYNHTAQIATVNNNVVGTSFNFDHVLTVYHGIGRGPSNQLFQAPLTTPMNLAGRIAYEILSANLEPYLFTSGGQSGASLIGIPQGNHLLTVTDALGCNSQKQFQVMPPEVITIEQNAVTNPSCHNSNDGAIDLNVQPGKITRSSATIPPGNLPSTAQFLQISNSSPFILEAIDVYVSENSVIEVYAKQGTFNGFRNNPGAWTSLGSYTLSNTGGLSRIQLTSTYLMSSGVNSFCIYASTGNLKNHLQPNSFVQSGITLVSSSGATGNAGAFSTSPKSNCYFAGALIYHDPNTQLSYQWSNNLNTESIHQLSSGTYSITISQGSSCQISRTFQLTSPTAISLQSTTTSETEEEQNGSASIQITGGTAPYYVQWSSLGITGTSVQNLPSGDYPVFIADRNGCVFRDSIHIDRYLPPIKPEGWLNIAPNPGQGFIKVSEEVKGMNECQLSLFDHLGRLVMKQETTISSLMTTGLNLSHLSDGNYILQVRDSDQLFHARAIIIR